jgi:hypothetical protein
MCGKPPLSCPCSCRVSVLPIAPWFEVDERVQQEQPRSVFLGSVQSQAHHWFSLVLTVSELRSDATSVWFKLRFWQMYIVSVGTTRQEERRFYPTNLFLTNGQNVSAVAVDVGINLDHSVLLVQPIRPGFPVVPCSVLTFDVKRVCTAAILVGDGEQVAFELNLPQANATTTTLVEVLHTFSKCLSSNQFSLVSRDCNDPTVAQFRKSATVVVPHDKGPSDKLAQSDKAVCLQDEALVRRTKRRATHAAADAADDNDHVAADNDLAATDVGGLGEASAEGYAHNWILAQLGADGGLFAGELDRLF